jgi:hypothetical protein
MLDLYNWPATSWPQPLPNGVITESNLNLGTSTTGNSGMPPLAEERCNICFTNPWYGLQYMQRTADTKMALATGGPKGSTKMNLWVISCSATGYSLPWAWGDDWSNLLTGSQITPQNIKIMDHSLDSNGNVYVVLPDNKTNQDVTPVVTGPASNYYTFNVTAAVIQVTFSMSNYQRIGITANGHNRAQSFTATVTPSTETNNIFYKWGDFPVTVTQNRGKVVPSLIIDGYTRTLRATNQGNGVITFSLVGAVASKTNGDALFVAEHLGFTSGTHWDKWPVGVSSNTVIVPASVRNPHPLSFNPVGMNVAASPQSVPPFWGPIPAPYDTILQTIYVSNIVVPVVDQFTNACGDLYDGALITENFASIGQTLSNSTYSDPIGPLYNAPLGWAPAQIPFVNMPYVQSNSPPGRSVIAAWVGTQQPVSALQSTLGINQDIGRRIEVDGFILNPGASNRTFTVTPPTVTIQWPLPE